MNEITRSLLQEQEMQVTFGFRKIAESILLIGKALKTIKDGELFKEKGYSNFADYMNDSAFDGVQIKSSQSYKYIAVYEKYGNRLAEINCNNLEVLYLLRDIPAEETDRLIESGELETMTKAEAEALKKELDAANQQIGFFEEEKKQAEEKLNAEKKFSKDTMDAFEESEQKCRELEKKLMEAEKALKEAESKPVEAAVIPAEEVIEQIRAEEKAKADKEAAAQIEQERSKAVATLNELQKLKNEQKEQINNALKDVLNEKLAADERIKKLESDLQSSGKPADEKLIEFKFYFQETQANLKKFIGVLNSIDDAEKREKFRSAAIKFVVGIEAELEKNETEGADNNG